MYVYSYRSNLIFCPYYESYYCDIELYSKTTVFQYGQNVVQGTFQLRSFRTNTVNK